MSVNRSSTYVRKAPRDLYGHSPTVTHSSTISEEEVIQDVTSPLIKELRLANPNLQPLSKLEAKEINSWSRRRNSLNLTHLMPPSSGQYHRHSLGSAPDISNSLPIKSSSTALPTALQRQNFWKYHILEIGDSFLYLTTNPDSKYLYCRNAPGIDVEIKKDRGDKCQNRRGFQLVFREQKSGKVFMIITRRVTNRSDDLYIESLGLFHTEKGDIIEVLQPEKQIGIAKLIPIKELEAFHYGQTSVKPVRYEFTKDEIYHVGSIPEYKPGTNKLKNKRFVFCTDESNKLMGLLRPHESRLKKKIMKKLSSSGRPKSMYSFREKSETKMNDVEHFYSAGDGLKPENPQDDSPNDQKLGWLTVYDHPILEKPGMWELFVGTILAVGYATIVDERLHSIKKNA